MSDQQGTIRRTDDGNVAIRFKYGYFVVGEFIETGTATDAQVAAWPIIFNPEAVSGLSGQVPTTQEKK